MTPTDPTSTLDAAAPVYNIDKGEEMGARVLGELEQVVMLALLRVGSEAYGVPVRDEVHRCTGRDLTLGAVYKTLERIEEKGFAMSWTGEPTPQRGGRRKRYYKVTGAGRAALRQSLGALRKLSLGLDLGLEKP